MNIGTHRQIADFIHGDFTDGEVMHGRETFLAVLWPMLRARSMQAGCGRRRSGVAARWFRGRSDALRFVLLAAAASALGAACAGGPGGAVADPPDVEAAVRSVWRGQSPATAVLVVDNVSGRIVDSVVVGETAVAPLGGRGRPAGSVMKVVVLAAAIEAGIEAEHVLNVPRCFELSQHRACTKTPGETTVAEAIVISNNPAFVMLAGLVGFDAVAEFGSRVGMDLEPDPAIPLGPDAVSMESVAALFATLANDGETVAIRDRTGSTVIHQAGRLASAGTARQLRLLLRSVVERGTGVAADGPDEPFGKTGTASNHTDAWFAGTAGDWTIVVWAGSEDGTTSVAPPKYRTALAGGGLPAEIFRAVADELGPRGRPEGASP